MAFPLDKIKTRVHEIDAELERLDKRTRVLKDEMSDLMTTLRVIEQYAEDEHTALPANAPGDSRRIDREEPGKPDKTTTAMIIEALEIMDMISGGPHSPKEIGDYLRLTAGVEFDGKRIAQVAWRLAKEGRILRISEGQYGSLPKNETPAVAPAGASKPETAAGTGQVSLFNTPPHQGPSSG